MTLRLGKTKIILITLLLVLAIGGTIGYLFFAKDDSSRPSELVGENDPKFKEVATYESILSLYNEEKFAEVIPQAKDYAANSQHDPTLRLIALDMCIKAAQKTNDSTSKAECYSTAKTQAGNLAREVDKENWQRQIEAANAETSETSTGDTSGPL